MVDGQHRILALRKLLDENFAEWAQFQIPFVCMLGADEKEEMTQFYIVNSTSESVRTDLALSLLKKRVDDDPALREDLQRRGRDWQVDGQSLVERWPAYLADSRTFGHVPKRAGPFVHQRQRPNTGQS